MSLSFVLSCLWKHCGVHLEEFQWFYYCSVLHGKIRPLIHSHASPVNEIQNILHLSSQYRPEMH
jgi:hypothetical protein